MQGPSGQQLQNILQSPLTSRSHDNLGKMK